MAARDRSLLWALLMTLASTLAVSVFSVVYTGQSSADNNRQWCELLTPLDTAYSSSPPQTELGRQVAAAIDRLSVRFGCEE